MRVRDKLQGRQSAHFISERKSIRLKAGGAALALAFSWSLSADLALVTLLFSLLFLLSASTGVAVVVVPWDIAGREAPDAGDGGAELNASCCC